MNSHFNCHCSCGEAKFNVSGEPLLRAFCHCTICQEFNQAPYADITLFRTKDVIQPLAKSVEFQVYRFPPFLQRGRCASCGKPTIEYLKLFPLPKLIIVPSAIIEDKEFVPEPSIHVFYETRVKDIEDDLPKYSGYLKSQLAFGHQLMASFLHKNKPIS